MRREKDTHKGILRRNLKAGENIGKGFERRVTDIQLFSHVLDTTNFWLLLLLFTLNPFVDISFLKVLQLRKPE